MQIVSVAESRLDGEQERIATEMNVPSVDENLYIKSLQNRDMPYKSQLTIFDSQNSKTKQPNTQLSTLTVRIAKQSNPTLGLVNLPSKIARQ